MIHGLQKRNSPLSHLRATHNTTLTQLENYRLLVESIQDYAIFLLDQKGYVMTWNKGAQKINGYVPEEIIGKHFSIFFISRDKESDKPAEELKLAQKLGRLEDEDWRLRKDGTKFWASVVITPLFNKAGTLIGYGKVTRDLTERKQYEDNLRANNLLLKQRQHELTHLNLAKDDFISLASHQLRTPATSIKQYLGMLLEGFVGDLPAEQLPFVQKAYQANEFQLSIVNNLLKVARIDAGRVVLKKVTTDITELISSVVEEYADSFRRREQTIITKVPAGLAAVIDPEHLRMVLENLIDNASKYTLPNGFIKVTARIVAHKLRIMIQDTGIGIETKDLSKLFSKFSRIPNELSGTVNGTGLGLYWANEIVLLHDGTIEVKSQPGKGTTFTIYVPLGVPDSA